MFVLKAIGRFFAKIGRWIRDTAWVQPLLIVGGIFAIIFSIPKIVSWVDGMNEESNAAQTFFENKIISAQGKEGKLSEGSVLDNYLSILENKDGSYSDKTAAYNAVNETLNLKGSKRFFVVFVDSTASCDSLYTGLNYLKDHWDNDEFKDLKGDFTYRTIYVDAKDKYDGTTNLFDDVYSRHNFENIATDLYLTQFAENKNYDEGDATHYDSLATSSNGFSVGTIMFFDYESEDYNSSITTKGLRSCFTTSDVAGSSDYERAQNLAKAWGEAKYSVFGPEYVK